MEFVVELARHAAMRGDVRKMVILTRLVDDTDYSVDYASPVEHVSPKLSIVRLPCGPKGYIPKERLWPYLDEFTDAALQYLSKTGDRPDVVHAHYADAAAVAVQLCAVLGLPLVFTSHSLGRQKQVLG